LNSKVKIDVIIHDKEICATDLPIGRAEFVFQNVKLNEYSKQWVEAVEGEVINDYNYLLLLLL